MDTRSSRHDAVEAVMELWDIDAVMRQYANTIDNDQTFFSLAAKHNGLLIQRVNGDLALLKRLNLPAILQFQLPEGQSPVYLTLSKMDGDKIILISGIKEQLMETNPEVLVPYWSGVAYVPWKNFLSLSGSIPLESPEDSIITLKMLMRDIGFCDIDMNPVYDELTRKAITGIQEKSGITVDGVVGPLTKIILYNKMVSLKIPHITK
jgi:general secretion pathway protein A